MTNWPINAKKAAHFAEISPLMLSYLERQELFVREEIRGKEQLEARRYGSRRKYSFRDVVVLRAISRLLRQGVSVQRIKRAVTRFLEDEKFACDRDRLLYNDAPVQFFVTDGSEVYFQRDGRELVALLSGGQGAFLFVLDVAEEHRKLRELSSLKQAKKASVF